MNSSAGELLRAYIQAYLLIRMIIEMEQEDNELYDIGNEVIVQYGTLFTKDQLQPAAILAIEHWGKEKGLDLSLCRFTNQALHFMVEKPRDNLSIPQTGFRVMLDTLNEERAAFLMAFLLHTLAEEWSSNNRETNPHTVQIDKHNISRNLLERLVAFEPEAFEETLLWWQQQRGLMLKREGRTFTISHV